MLKVKLKAALLHLLASVLVVSCAAVLVFYVWYPGEFSSMLGGLELFLFVAMCEVLLGPVISLVIYNPAKPKKELFRDYAIVLSIQLAALIYGLYAVALSRPVYLVFVKDRIEVIAAVEIDEVDLKAAKYTEYSRLSWSGYKRVCVDAPTDKDEKSELLFSAVEGKDIQHYPKYYRPCGNDEVIAAAYASARLKEIVKSKLGEGALFKEVANMEYSWLPIKHRFGVWVEIYMDKDLERASYIAVNPYDES
ncbi:hypothetical protein [Dasania marina]|uniref:hypothetical protein n=1 Tax=Dasania marina TaxID=471499 RepID=UPI0004B2D7AD|nr:hypothetical protein [Dasania marina]